MIISFILYFLKFIIIYLIISYLIITYLMMFN